jgi:hypothetical protein
MLKNKNMKNLYRILTLVIAVSLFSQCADDGDYDHPINRDNIPAVPILFTGATTYGGNPYYQVAFASGAAAFSITISVPDDSPLKIKEITKMIAGTTSVTPGNVTTASVANYLTAPISVNGTTTTINSSLTEFNLKVATASRVTQALVDAAATSTPATPYVERAFLFLVTLEDGSTIITEQVRLRVIK